VLNRGSSVVKNSVSRFDAGRFRLRLLTIAAVARTRFTPYL